MKALTYIEHGKFALLDKPKPVILDPRDAVVRVTLGSICTSDLHIKHGSVPLITQRYNPEDIEEAYHLFENKLDGGIKVAVIAN